VKRNLVLALVVALVLLVGIPAPGELVSSAQGGVLPAATDDDLVFIHHSCGSNWLGNSLHDALLAKDYIDERNDITYGTDLAPDAGRPDSLASTPGDQTNMNHWVRWFNDYLDGVKAHGTADGVNRIIMFKSCYPISNVTGDGTEPGDPFSSSQTTANYKAVYRHANGSGNTYSYGGYTYKPLEDIFAENPDTLFIPVTAPPRHYAPSDATNDTEAGRARQFNNWLKNDWLDGYNAAHPGLNNVAVFDWFDVLAYPDDHGSHPNRLKAEYGGESGNSHPNSTANSDSTAVFATNPDSFIDGAWCAFAGCGDSSLEPSTKAVYPTLPDPGDVLTYTVRLENGGALLSSVRVTDTLPADLHYLGNLWASSGSYGESGGVITWTGSVGSAVPVTITYGVTVAVHLADPQVVSNTALIDDGDGNVLQRQAMVIVNAHSVWLPLVLREVP
jgi:uncharacterized repeat protein (TIGR01451 family)